VGALSDAKVGEYFAKHFVAAHEQVGDFEVVNVKGTLTKNGGNVASYFCTPEGRVVHAVLGPVTADELLEQAKWAVENYQAISGLEEVYRQQGILAKAHRGALSKPNPKVPIYFARGSANRTDSVHLYLAEQKFPKLDSIYRHVFEELLGEQVSNTRDLKVAEEKIRIAERSSRPILIVLNRSSYNMNKTLGRSAPRSMLGRYMVISLKPKDLPALSRLTKQPPYEVGGLSATTYVVCRSNGEQIGSVVQRSFSDLSKLLAEGLAQNALSNPPDLKELKDLVRLVERYNESFGDELRQLYQRRANSIANDAAKSADELLAEALLEE
jgi:hypothetical protein